MLNMSSPIAVSLSWWADSKCTRTLAPPFFWMVLNPTQVRMTVGLALGLDDQFLVRARVRVSQG